MSLKVNVADRPIDPGKIEDSSVYAIDYGPSTFVVMAVQDTDRQSFLPFREITSAIWKNEVPGPSDRASVQAKSMHELGVLTLEPAGAAGEITIPFGDWQPSDLVRDSAGKTFFVVKPPRGYYRQAGFGFAGFEYLFYDAETGKAGRPTRPVSVYGCWRIGRSRSESDGGFDVLVERRRQAEGDLDRPLLVHCCRASADVALGRVDPDQLWLSASNRQPDVTGTGPTFVQRNPSPQLAPRHRSPRAFGPR